MLKVSRERTGAAINLPVIYSDGSGIKRVTVSLGDAGPSSSSVNFPSAHLEFTKGRGALVRSATEGFLFCSPPPPLT